MIFVLHIEGKREDLDRLKVVPFASEQDAINYCQKVNEFAFDKYYKYAEIIDLDVMYEPLIRFDKKSIK